jgi:TfoX/Sxy family transcriptional regulator of competence genes
MEFRKSPQELIDAFEAAMPGAPAVKRPMFGYPAGFVNGNMFTGLFADKMFVRLPEDSRAELMGIGGTPFEPMPGRPMREYVVIPEKIIAKPAELKAWAGKALRYGASLPVKKKKPTSGASKSGKKSRKKR